MSDQPQGQDEAVTDQGQGGFSPFAAPTGGQGQIDAFPPPPVAPVAPGPAAMFPEQPPTAAQIGYVRILATRKRVPIPNGVFQSKAQASAFIDLHR